MWRDFDRQLSSDDLTGGRLDDLKQRVLLFPGNNEAVVDTEDGEVEAGGYGQDLVGDLAVGGIFFTSEGLEGHKRCPYLCLRWESNPLWVMHCREEQVLFALDEEGSQHIHAGEI